MPTFDSSTSKNSEGDHLSKPLDSKDPPLGGQFCDLVIEGGVINGVAYPGFLVEVARRYHLHAVGGASVGAIAAALAVACEYGRRYGSLDGYNEGLRKLPDTLAEWMDKGKSTTRIRSLFQPLPKLNRLFDFAVDAIEEGTRDKENPVNRCKWISRYLTIFYRHFLCHWILILASFVLCIGLPNVLYLNPVQANHPVNEDAFRWLFFFLLFKWVLGFFVLHPVCSFFCQINRLRKTQGFGMCTGMPVNQNGQEALINWLYKGVQDAAGLPYARPLTFGDLWRAPGGPLDAKGEKLGRSIDLRTITTCLSHGRIYEMPLQDKTARLFFRLSEFKEYFPTEIIDHLRHVSKKVDIANDPIIQLYETRRKFLNDPKEHSYSAKVVIARQNRLNHTQALVAAMLNKSESTGVFNDADIRELPSADLPIVIAARLSLSVPILFKAIPMLAFDLEANAENMALRRVWFSDGGIGSNFPIHLFDKALPKWPTFGVKVLETSAEMSGSDAKRTSYVSYFHDRSKNDIFVIDPEHKTGFNYANKSTPTWAAFGAFLMGIFQAAKDGGDQAYLRMPDVRGRILKLYTDHATGNALNLKIKPSKIYDVAKMGTDGGVNLVKAYLGKRIPTRRPTANQWYEHRWICFNALINSLRTHLTGFELAAFSNTFHLSIFEQIDAAKSVAPLQSVDSKEYPLTTAQANQLKKIAAAIIQLEHTLTALNLPLPYVPEPESALKTKPKF